MAYAPRTKSRAGQNGKTAKSIATTRQQLRDNTERLQGPDVSGSAAPSNYDTRARTGENTEMYITTCHDGTAVKYDDIVESGTKYHYPDQFERTVDRSDRVPGWSSVKEDIVPKDAVFRTIKESQVVEGFHKGPKMHQYTVEENNRISMGGQVRPTDKMPTYAPDRNHVSTGAVWQPTPDGLNTRR